MESKYVAEWCLISTQATYVNDYLGNLLVKERVFFLLLLLLFPLDHILNWMTSMKPSIAKCLVYWWSQHSSCTAFSPLYSKGFQFSKLVCCLRYLKNVMASKPVFQLQWGKHDAWPVAMKEDFSFSVLLHQPQHQPPGCQWDIEWSECIWACGIHTRILN